MSARPDIQPGLWLYGYLSGEAHARENLSSLGLSPEKIHVAPIAGWVPEPPDMSGYLPLSGGTLTGELAFNVPNKTASIFDGQTLRLDPGALAETSVSFPMVGGSHDVAYSDNVWQKSDQELSVGNSSWQVYVDPGAVTVQDYDQRLPIGPGDVRKRTRYLWDGLTYTVTTGGATPPSQNYNLMFPEEGGTIATQKWAQRSLVNNMNGLSAMLSADAVEWADISATANPNTLYIITES